MFSPNMLQHLKDKISQTFLYGFIEIVNESERKPNKLWFYQEREFCNILMLKWLYGNNILKYSTHNEGKSVVAEG